VGLRNLSFSDPQFPKTFSLTIHPAAGILLRRRKASGTVGSKTPRRLSPLITSSMLFLVSPCPRSPPLSLFPKKAFFSFASPLALFSFRSRTVFHVPTGESLFPFVRLFSRIPDPPTASFPNLPVIFFSFSKGSHVATLLFLVCLCGCASHRCPPA